MTESPERACNHLVLLVGSNPLPNYLATLVLHPTSVQLLYTKQTEDIKDKLRSALERRLPNLKVSGTYVENDGTDAQSVRDACRSLPGNAHLHYTGGTKIMAANARLAFLDRDGKDDQASYLDERNGVLRYDNGDQTELLHQNLKLKLDDILSLHGIIKQPESKSKPRVEEAIATAESVLKEGKACSSSGDWLEVWTGEKVKCILNKQPEIGLNCKRENGREFEIDVVIIHGHRLYVISCTTKTNLSGCKPKLFEVAMRARQLGGDLARSALVCLLCGSDPKGAKIDQLRHDVADVWGAINTPQVFGQDDLKEWAGIAGKPNTNSLKKWLNE
jgi:hypothetical protein